LELFRWVQLKLKALDPKAEVAKVNDYLLENQLMVRSDLPMSFYVVSVKDRIQESTGNIMYPPLLPSDSLQ
jgi:hypothetical protein